MRPDAYKQQASRKYQARQRAKGTSSSSAAGNQRSSNSAGLQSNSWRFEQEQDDSGVDIATETRELNSRIKQVSLGLQSQTVNIYDKDRKVDGLDLEKLDGMFRGLFRKYRGDLGSAFSKIDSSDFEKVSNVDISILMNSPNNNVVEVSEKVPVEEPVNVEQTIDDEPPKVDISKEETHEELEEWLDDILG